ncbi:MAG: hypothetical protein AAFN11_19530, partial [Chloroflexota bacterium]
MKSYFVEQHSRRDLRRAIKRADPKFFEPALIYLEDDPYTFGSGYRKVDIWRYIRRYDLQDADIQRLEQAALQYLARPMSREFKHMCQTMCRIATDDFWAIIEEKRDSDVPRVQVNAYCLHAYADGMMAGEKRRLWLRRMKLDMHRRSRKRLSPVFSNAWLNGIKQSDVLKILLNSENWYEGIISFAEHPIHVDHRRKRELLFKRQLAAFDFSNLKTEQVITSLIPLLRAGPRTNLTFYGWRAVLFVFQKMNTPKTIPILDYFFEGGVQWTTYRPIRERHTE